MTAKSYDHNDLFDAFAAGFAEGRYDREWHTPETFDAVVRHEFEDWLRNHEAEK